MLAQHEEGHLAVQNIKARISTPYPPASAPNTPPHMRTDTLRASVDYSVQAAGPIADLTLKVDAPYAVHLEYGTQSMAPRPFVRPEVARIRQSMPATLRKHLDQI